MLSTTPKKHATGYLRNIVKQVNKAKWLPENHLKSPFVSLETHVLQPIVLQQLKTIIFMQCKWKHGIRI